MEIDSKILVTGSGGVLGSALVEELNRAGFKKILTPNKYELNCLDYDCVNSWFEKEMPDYVFHLASLVYGINGNLNNQLKSIYENTRIAESVIYASAKFNVKKIFYAGTVASYPYPFKKLPLEEKYFLDGEPHYAEYGYATAKRYALSLLKIINKCYGTNYSYGIFTNIYGPRDRFDPVNGHVIPSLIKKAFESQSAGTPLEVWGNPDTVRDFIFSHDAARAAIHCMVHNIKIANISTGVGYTIKQIVDIINDNFEDKLNVSWKKNMPVGIKCRIVSNKILEESGFVLNYSIAEGLALTINWFKDNQKGIRL